MKKITLVLSVVLMAALLAFSAVAAPVDYETDTNAAFDVTYTGTAGAYYAIVAVEGIAAEGTAPAITEDSIQYIDQKTADADGSVAFEDILLKVDGTAATIYLGGSDLDEAVLLGWVNKPADEPDEYAVSGTVTLTSEATSASTVTLTSTADETKVYTVETVNGIYTITVPADTYKFVVTKALHLSYTKAELAVAGDTTVDVTLVGGDTDADGAVNTADLTEVLVQYGKSAEDAANCDIDDDGSVSVADLTAILTAFGKSAVEE